MNRSLLSTLALVSLGSLTACGADPNDPASLGDEVSAAEQGLGDAKTPWTAHMAALGDLTLRCWGTVGPNTYTTKNGWLQPTRRGCTKQPGLPDKKPLDPAEVWALLEGNLGIQFLENTPEHPNPDAEQHSREARTYMVDTWNTWLATSPPPQNQCPRWEILKVAQDPKEDPGYFAKLPRAPLDEKNPVEVREEEFNAFGKTLPLYRITPTKCDQRDPRFDFAAAAPLKCVDPCRGNPECLVKYADKCAGGFGYPFLHAPDPANGQYQVDPLYWEETREDYPAADNPFMEDDYFHGMSFWGPTPGAVYGAVPRETEPCSVKSGASHLVTSLKGVWCSALPSTGTPVSWKCLSQCKM